MNYLRPFPISDNYSNAMANIVDVINSLKIHGGNGIQVSQTNDGYTITLKQQNLSQKVVNKGYYDFTQEYFPNDLVVVKTTGTASISSSTQHYTAGTYICLQHVPASSNDSDYFLNTIAPANSNANDYDANAYRWYQVNNYGPTTSSYAATTTAISGYNINASQSFWLPLAAQAQGGGVSYKGEYDIGAEYNKGDIVMVSPDNLAAIQGHLDRLTVQKVQSLNNNGSYATTQAGLYSIPGQYLCLYPTQQTVDSTSGSVFSGSTQYDVPTFPNFFGGPWALLQPYPETKYIITDLYHQYYVYQDYMAGYELKPSYYVSGSNLIKGYAVGTTKVYIAKQNRLRTSIASEDFNGTHITFLHFSDNIRIARDPAGNIETQATYPLFTTLTGSLLTSVVNGTYTGSWKDILNDKSCITCFVPLNGTGVSTTEGQPVFIEEIPHRVWAKPYAN